MRGLVLDYGGVLTDFDGGPIDGEGPLCAVARRLRRERVRTAVLSNASPVEQPEWAQLFDAVVFAGAVGVAKPDPESYLITARKLDLVPEECVFVDDVWHNVEAAVAVGMVGVHHREVPATIDELAALFDVPLLERR